MSEGKFFFIRSKLSGLVLQIRDNVVSAGQPVAPYSCDGMADSQQWYVDKIAKVIRSKANDSLVLDVQDGQLIVNDFHPEEQYQHWELRGDQIINNDDDNICLDIAQCDSSEGARVCAWEVTGDVNQQWEMEYLAPAFCYIVSKMDGRVIDIRDAENEPGTKVITWSKHDTEVDNQIWWEDKYGNIRSKMNPDFVFDCTEGSCRVQPYDPDVRLRQWVKYGNKIVVKDDQSTCLQVMDAGEQGLRKAFKGRKLDCAEYVGAEHQIWDFEYL